MLKTRITNNSLDIIFIMAFLLLSLVDSYFDINNNLQTLMLKTQTNSNQKSDD